MVCLITCAGEQIELLYVQIAVVLGLLKIQVAESLVPRKPEGDNDDNHHNNKTTAKS